MWLRYGSIRSLDISNGTGVGVSLFVQGCKFKCHNCFNSELWDFTKGCEWTTSVEEDFIKLIDRPYINRVSVLGGEPLAEENIDTVLHIVTRIKSQFPNKQIWLYSGYTWEKIYPYLHTNEIDKQMIIRQNILKNCDVMIDGQFIDELKDLSLEFRGSKNQRIIDVQKSIDCDCLILWQRN